MIESICFVQEGRIQEKQKGQLEAELARLTNDYFTEDISINWTTIARGNGWTGVGKATGANIALYVPDTPQESRAALLSDICKVWMDVTGCKITEIVVSALNRN